MVVRREQVLWTLLPLVRSPAQVMRPEGWRQESAEELEE